MSFSIFNNFLGDWKEMFCATCWGADLPTRSAYGDIVFDSPLTSFDAELVPASGELTGVMIWLPELVLGEEVGC